MVIGESNARRALAQCRLPRVNHQPQNQHAPREPHAAACCGGHGTPAPTPAILNGGPLSLFLMISCGYGVHRRHNRTRSWRSGVRRPASAMPAWMSDAGEAEVAQGDCGIHKVSAIETGAVTEADLVRWLEHKTVTDYRKGVLRPMHKDRLIDYDSAKRTIRLLPPGVTAAEAIVTDDSSKQPT